MDASDRHARARNYKELARAYRRVRDQSTMLVADLSPEDCMVQSMEDASPVKWHLAHVTWFFETLVLETWLPRMGRAFRPFCPAYRTLFNSYYVGIGAFHPRAERGALSRPSLTEVRAYRAAIDDQMLELMLSADCAPELARLITLGINHEQQHQELILTDLKHHFSRNPLLPAFCPRRSEAPPGAALEGRFVAFAGGVSEIGHRGESFCFDNERPRHRVWIEPFEMANRPVTNGEFLEFVRDGGYRSAQWWLSDGWDTVCRQRWDAPLYWLADGDVFTLAGRQPLEPAEPVCHVSYYEADAFARWAKARLPTESEWEHAAQSQLEGASAVDGAVRGNFLESGSMHPRVPGGAQNGDGGLTQLFGDVWEWTQSAYLPYPGFEPNEGAVGEYNGKFMVNQMVLRGGSCATPADHMRASYRNFFHPHARWQFSGFRLVRDL